MSIYFLNYYLLKLVRLRRDYFIRIGSTYYRENINS